MKEKTLKLTRAALIAALYVILTLLSQVLNLYSVVLFLLLQLLYVFHYLLYLQFLHGRFMVHVVLNTYSDLKHLKYIRLSSAYSLASQVQ